MKVKLKLKKHCKIKDEVCCISNVSFCNVYYYIKTFHIYVISGIILLMKIFDLMIARNSISSAY